MCSAKSKSLIFIGLLFSCLEMISSADTGFSMSTYDVTSRSIYLRWPKFSGASSYRVTATAVNTVGHSLLAHFSDVTLKGTLTSLIPNTIYAIQAEAIDKNGFILAETQIMQSTAPDIPVIDQAYSKLSNSITVEWRAVPGATGYLLTAQDGDSFVETVVTDSPGTVTGLKPATLYRITIRSINSGGKSQPSPFRKAKTVLAAPILSVSSLSCDSIAVSWKAVYMAAGFSVSLMRSDGLGRMLKENTTNTSLIFTNLDPGTLYTIKAYAWNVNGIPGDDFTYNQRTSPKAPADVQVSFNSGALRAIVSWMPTEGALTYSVTASRGLLELKCNTSSASCLVPSLQCGSEYYVSVTAYNDAGSSKPTDPVSLKTIPCAPVNISIEEDEPGHLLVSWTSVSFGDYYVVFVKSDDGLEVHCNTSHTQCHFQSDCGFTYFISVFAYNKAGQSPLGDVFNYTTAPCSPEIKNISKEARSVISVHWQSNNEAATYIVTARGEAGLWHCTSSGNSCTLFNIPCGSAFSVSAIAKSPAGQSLPSYSVPLETAPCCPDELMLTQVTQSVTNISWSVGMGAQTYIMTLESPKGQAKCHTLQNYCLLGCITCSTNYTVSLKAISETGLTSSCTYQGYSSSACCPSGVKLFRLSNNGIRVYWRASDERINYNTDLHGSKGNFTCSPSSGLSHCDITEIPCGDVYTVVVSPVTDKGTKLTFCPKRIYSVTCSGSSVGMVIYRGKSNAEQHV
ncbi:PREDICTED: fibronectin type III domain-containing protein 7 [Calidris pugnax]|uniref:fibronectin type III domain-containing protein 7 n=1 Tax=Calidris pugnax TaxID=198806 RepID=UPI00071CF403|nr:PREDICTED: fibronectin type III domain-containing protein 7 [Calidris pugnax]XP_014798894.1 PREDICTED: fibronectin type III domain-containing protein 7 [Calidris pugnax]